MFPFYLQSTFPNRRKAILPFRRTPSWSLNHAQPQQAPGSRAASADTFRALRPENQLTALEQVCYESCKWNEWLGGTCTCLPSGPIFRCGNWS